MVDWEKLRKSKGLDVTPKLSVLQRLGDVISRPGRFSANIAEAAVTGKTKPIAEAFQSINPLTILDTLFTGAARPEAERETYAKVLKKGGVGELGSVDLPILGKVTGRGALGFAGDVFLDPLTYLSFGAGKGLSIGGKVLSKAGKAQLGTLTAKAAKEIGEELLTKGIKLGADDLGKAAFKRATRDLNKIIGSGNAGNLIEKGGVKLLGKSLIQGDDISKVTSPIGKAINKIPGVEPTKDFIGKAFSRDYGLPDKTKNIMQKYYNKINDRQSKLIDDVTDAFKIGDDKVVDLVGREKIGKALAAAEDESKDLLAKHLYKINTGKAGIKNMGKEIKLSKEISAIKKTIKKSGGKSLDDIKKQISEIADKLDNPNMDVNELRLAKASLESYTEALKKSGIDRGVFDKIAFKHIKSLDKELRPAARKMWLALRRAEKYDDRVGLLRGIMPNYFPRKYMDLKDVAFTGSSTGPGGELIKSIGGRLKHRKLWSHDDATEWAASHGGKLVDDAPIPVVERLLRGAKAREGINLEKELMAAYDGTLPVQVLNHLKAINSRGIADETLRTAAQAYDKVLNIYKGSLTSMFPAFHARNAISNKFLSFLGGGIDAIRPSTMKATLDMKMGKAGSIVSDYGVKVSYDDIIKNAKKYNVTSGFFGGDVVEEVPKIIAEKLSKNKMIHLAKNPMEAGKKVGQLIEQTDRLSLFTAFLKKGFSYEDAAKGVKKFLFDYDNLSNVEKMVMKRVLPFYTFKRKSIELFAEQLVKEPRIFDTLGDFKNFLQDGQMSVEEMSKLPDWMKERILIKTGKNKYLTGIDLGFEDALATIGRPQQLMGQISPMLKIPIEQATERDLFREQSLRESASNITDIPPILMNNPIGKMLGFRKDDSRYMSTNPRLLELIRNMPTSRIIATAAMPTKEGTSGTDFLAKFLTGIKQQNVSPSYMEYLQQKRADEALLESGEGKEFRKVYIPKKKKR